MHRRLSTRSLPASANPPMPQGHCTVTQIRHWASTFDPVSPRQTVTEWQEGCSRAGPNPGSHATRNRNLYMQCVLATYTDYDAEAIAQWLNKVLGLNLCRDTVEYAQRKMKWNGMLKRIQEKGLQHPWVMQAIDRLGFKSPSSPRSPRSASKDKMDLTFMTHPLGNRRIRRRDDEPRRIHNERHHQARSRAARSPNFTTRCWARKPLYIWLWLFQRRCRFKYNPTTRELDWENPARRTLWCHKASYEQPPALARGRTTTPTDSEGELPAPLPSLPSLNSAMGLSGTAAGGLGITNGLVGGGNSIEAGGVNGVQRSLNIMEPGLDAMNHAARTQRTYEERHAWSTGEGHGGINGGINGDINGDINGETNGVE